MDKINLSKIIMDDEKVVAWIDAAPGAFHVSHITHDTALQLQYTQKFEMLVKVGYIERFNDRRGWYRPRQTDLIEMDYKNASGKPVEIWLPFELDDLVKLYKGNIFIISGCKDAGKTALILNIIYQNEDEWNIHYFNSECGEDEFQTRLGFFDREIDAWKFRAYERSSNFADVIKPGEGNLNIIDFLEVHGGTGDEYYTVGGKIRDIHDRLKGALCIIALQQRPGNEVGLGGYSTIEKARLAISLNKGMVKIIVAKNFRDPKKNPWGLMRNFKLVNGCNITTQYPWQRELEV